jgi:tetratricopeptide (TPR) repeat protein
MPLRLLTWHPPAYALLSAAMALVGCARALAAERASWHHSGSPYRAVFRVTSEPTQRDAGYALTIPISGLGSEEGMDLYAFDQAGNPLRLMPLGKGADNTVLALVKGSAPCTEICAYFGSKMRAPVVTKGFLQNLTLDVRTLPEGSANTWNEVKVLLGKSERLGALFVDRIEQSFNPVDSSDACILVFDGHLQQPSQASVTFMLVTDDAGYLFIDDQLLISRDGRHYAGDAVRGEFRKEVALAPGPHTVRLVVVDFGGDLMALLARWQDAKNKGPLPPEAFVQSGRTRCQTVEAHYRDAPMPAFRYKIQSYMSYNGAQFTEVLFEAVNGRESTWRFEDGARFRGATCTRVLPGLASRGVACTQRDVTAKGLVQISEALPRALSVEKGEDFRHYSGLILQQNLEDMEAATLRGYLTLLSYIPLNEDAIPVCEALIANPKASGIYRRAALIELGRAGGRRFPDKARKAYAELLKAKPDKTWEADAREAAQFALFCVRDFDWAATIVQQLAKQADKNDKSPAELRLDLALQTGQTATAKERLEDLLGGREFGQKQRYAAVQGNALRQRFYDLLYGGFVIEAWEVLNEWSGVAPADRLNGSLSLARARLWRRLGWLDGALGELDGAILLDPLLSNLPEVELERGKILVESGDQQRANEVFGRVSKEYPNHPVANEAKVLVR